MMYADEEVLIRGEDDGDGISGNAVKDTNKRIKTRNVLAFLGFLGFANVYAMRVNLSVAIVAMVNTTTNGNGSHLPSRHSVFSVVSPLFHPPSFHSTLDTHGNGSQPVDDCPVRLTVNMEKFSSAQNDVLGGEFPWDERTQGLVLGSFFYGYVTTQVPGGRMSEIFGGRHIFGLGVLFTGIFTLLSPPVARTSHAWGITPFVILRILEGLAEGVTFPAMMAMFAKWVPPLERSKITAFVYSGALFGTVVSMPISGLLCNLDLPVYWWLLGPGGWPIAFYVFGALGVVWYIAWMSLVSDTPSSHPNICPQERLFIEHSLSQNNEWDQGPRRHSTAISRSDDSSVSSSVPWCHLVTSVPLWAALLTMCGQSWAFYTLLTELPTYMDKILHYNITQDSFLSTLPYLGNWIFSAPFSWTADFLRSRRYISTTASLKIFNSIAVVVPSLAFIGIAFAGCHSNFILFLLVVSGVFTGAGYAGVQVNHLALSPRLAGTLYGITNSFSNVCGFLAPYATGSIVNGHETIAKWRTVFLLSAGVNLFLNFIYIIFASGELQPWDDPHLNIDQGNCPHDSLVNSPQPMNDDKDEETSSK